MFNVAVYQFTYSFRLLSTTFGNIERRLDSFNYLFFIRLAPCGIFVLRFTSRMWNWVRCGSLLIYVVVDNQTEKLKITRTTHLNRDIDIYVDECKLRVQLTLTQHIGLHNGLVRNRGRAII